MSKKDTHNPENKKCALYNHSTTYPDECVCTCFPQQQSGWREAFDEQFGVFSSNANKKPITSKAIKAFIASVEAEAEARGKIQGYQEEGIRCHGVCKLVRETALQEASDAVGDTNTACLEGLCGHSKNLEPNAINHGVHVGAAQFRKQTLDNIKKLMDEHDTRRT